MNAKRELVNKRHGFTVLELLVTVSMIGILLALILPALGTAREAARRVQCTDHLRELGMALHNHHSAKRQLPPGWTFDKSKTSAYGWAVALLPYIEENALASQIDVTLTVNHSRHDIARTTSLAMMLCPSDITEPMFTLFEGSEDEEDDNLGRAAMAQSVSPEPTALLQLPTANYVGMFGTLEADDTIPAQIGDGAFLENRAVRFRDFQRGLSNTIIVGERTMAQVPSTWLGVMLAGEDAAARLVGSALEGINNPLADECDHSSRHPGGANFLWGDGHVTFVNEDVSPWEYHHWAKLREN
ncbi:DUF1559 domain-containing protein [Aporhodopirellula aestuarii]|uniref:DUF1559 domain-containing protein n=1 Tax=Aporhodopirellula aestuarii TaxID=2950107 RepID=A0ABT0UAS5_9BACT|nr:DUF1559 domain-containing protein [Aporhodopirellula aestuarii]MCM2374112.1 DUF1559 domain-containing protein [Aporhodopirellula aestuarii]